MASKALLIFFKPTFIRQINKLEPRLQAEVLEKINLFKDRTRHTELKVHKLHGPLAGRWSFSINYRYCVVFVWAKENAAILLAIGDHEMYS